MKYTYLLFLFAACSATVPSDGVMVRLLSTQASSVVGVSQAFEIEVANLTSSEVLLTVPPCGGALDIRSTAGDRVGAWAGRPCAAVAPSPTVISAGATHRVQVSWDGSATGTDPVPAFVSPGRYSLRGIVWLNGQMRTSEPVLLELKAADKTPIQGS